MGIEATVVRLGMIVALGVVVTTAAHAQTIAVTIDDIPGRSDSGNCDLEAVADMNERILTALEEAGAPAIGFVTEGSACASLRDTILTQVLGDWLDRGFTLGNHTFSHPDLNSTPAEAYKRDIDAGARMTRPMMEDRGEQLRYFRYPQLHVGSTPEKRSEIESFLDERGYISAPVTIDSQEWLFARAYDQALRDDRDDRALCIGDQYVPFMESVVAFFEHRSREILGREPAQVLLLHASELNAARLPDLLEMFADRGYRFISLDEALEDPAYSIEDGYVGPRGLSWIHRWGLTQGFEVEEEPREPVWLQNTTLPCPETGSSN